MILLMLYVHLTTDIRAYLGHACPRYRWVGGNEHKHCASGLHSPSASFNQFITPDTSASSAFIVHNRSCKDSLSRQNSCRHLILSSASQSIGICSGGTRSAAWDELLAHDEDCWRLLRLPSRRLLLDDLVPARTSIGSARAWSSGVEARMR